MSWFVQSEDMAVRGGCGGPTEKRLSLARSPPPTAAEFAAKMPAAITEYATEQLSLHVDGLVLAEGLQVTLADGWVRGDVSISERKGKHFAVYSLELELPWAGHGCSGLLVLPDVCLELLADVEVEVQTTVGELPSEVAAVLQAAGVAAVRAAVQEWGHALAKTVREDSTRAGVPVDPPSEAQAPRAALISEEEAMSASGAAALDEADEEEEAREVLEEDEPFTEEEVDQMVEDITRLAGELYSSQDQLSRFLGELDEELIHKARCNRMSSRL